MRTPLLTSSNETRQAFKRYLNPFMLLMWRLGFGKMMNAAPQYGGRLMVMTHTGRKSGKRYRQPLNYAMVDGELYCTAGFGRGSDWYKNILANPQVEVWLPDGRWTGIAEDASDSPQRTFFLRQAIIASGLAGYAAGFDAKNMSDAELDSLLDTYCLIHIHRTQPCTGKGGPGDLAWMVPASALVVLTLLLFRKGRQSGGTG